MKPRRWVAILVFLLLAGLFFIRNAGWGQAPPAGNPQLLDKGKKLFARHCAPCHGLQGDGQGPMAKILKPSALNFTIPLPYWPNSQGVPEKIFANIRKGVRGTAMIKYTFPDEDVWALVYTVMAFARDDPDAKK